MNPLFASALAGAWRKRAKHAATAVRFILCAMLLLPGLAFSPIQVARADQTQRRGARLAPAPPSAQGDTTAPSQGETTVSSQDETPEAGGGNNGGVYQPSPAPFKSAPSINFGQAAEQAALAPTSANTIELKAIDPPKPRPEFSPNADRMSSEETFNASEETSPQPPAPSAQGSSPAPFKTFQGEFLSGTSIPPDTMGAVGPNHVVSVSNNQMNIRTRDGVILQRMTLNAFWQGVALESGNTTPSTFDPKILYDRFADRYILFTSANSVSPDSAVLFAVTQTGNPLGGWDRYVFDADPTATGGTTGTGRWADYPTIGFNKNWIVANYNVFNYSGTATTGYYGPYIYVIPKADAYDGGGLAANLFQDSFTNCTAPFEQKLGCGFTMAPTVNEDNTSETLYLVEDWDSVFGQLRLSKITGTPTSPTLFVGTQFPQSTENWRFNAARIGTSGGYVPQRQQLLFQVSGSRVMANDARINNAVFRNGSLWTSHHVMVGATPNAPGTAYGSTNPDIKTAAQWWEINPTVEAQPDSVTGLGTPPVQRGRIVDPTATNCHNGNSGEAAGCTQQGQFFFFAGIAVNKDNDVLVGFTQGSPLTYLSGAYAMRRATDPLNTMRDVVVFHSGEANYNIGVGAGTGRQNRWGDYSASMVDPLNDTDFWTVQEYAGTKREFGIGATATPWETWWAQVKPNSTQPTTTGNLIISEFRLRGPQGVRDEFVEVYNPNTTTPFRVQSVDNTEGWTLAANNGTTTTALTTIPQGTVIPPRGSFLIVNGPDGGAGGTVTNTYSLNGYPNVIMPNGSGGATSVRGATMDTGYYVDVSDVSGIALFKTTNSTAGFTAPNISDAAGPSTLPVGSIYREGAGYAPLPTTNLGYTMFRNFSSGQPQDTNDNAADFMFADTAATSTTAGQRLGAPGPQNVDSPLVNFNIFVDRIDQSVGASQSPNRHRDTTPVTNGSLGTLSFRRKVGNHTGAPVKRLRFRIRQITTAPAPGGTADLRALTSGFITVTSNDAAQCFPAAAPCSLGVLGTTLEQPPTQSLGGGWDATLSVELVQPIIPGSSVNVQFLYGVQQTGSFSIFINPEALP